MKKLLGKRIKELRQKKHYTQENLAEILGIGERNLSKIECGVNFMSAETLEKLVHALDVSYKELFDFEHLNPEVMKKNELIDAIKRDYVDIELMYRIYSAIKK